MKRNVANTEVTPKFPAVDEHIRKLKFLDTLRVTDMFASTFANGEVELIRKRRKQLEDGLPLLDEPENRELCKKLIKFFNQTLVEKRAKAAIRPHEKFLSKHLG
jgi:hypothetical protein